MIILINFLLAYIIIGCFMTASAYHYNAISRDKITERTEKIFPVLLVAVMPAISVVYCVYSIIKFITKGLKHD